MPDKLDPFGLDPVAPHFPNNVAQPFRSVDEGEGASRGDQPCGGFYKPAESQGQFTAVGIGGFPTAYGEVGWIGNHTIKAAGREILTDLADIPVDQVIWADPDEE